MKRNRKNGKNKKKQSPLNNQNSPEEPPNADMSDTEDDSSANTSKNITTDDLDRILARHLEPIHASINETIEKLSADIDAIKLIANNAYKLAQENQKITAQLKQENNTLKNQ